MFGCNSIKEVYFSTATNRRLSGVSWSIIAPPFIAALAHANALGALWLTRHQPLIDACPIAPVVIRWQQWYAHTDYANVRDGCQRAYEINSVLRGAVETDIEGFFRRQVREPSAAERRHSCDYLLEELAVMILQAREMPSLKLYPGDELFCLNVVRRGLIPEAPLGLEREQFAKVKISHARICCGERTLQTRDTLRDQRFSAVSQARGA